MGGRTYKINSYSCLKKSWHLYEEKRIEVIAIKLPVNNAHNKHRGMLAFLSRNQAKKYFDSWQLSNFFFFRFSYTEYYTKSYGAKYSHSEQRL